MLCDYIYLRQQVRATLTSAAGPSSGIPTQLGIPRRLPHCAGANFGLGEITTVVWLFRQIFTDGGLYSYLAIQFSLHFVLQTKTSMTLPKHTEEEGSVESYLEVDGCSSATFSSLSFVRGLQTLTISDTQGYRSPDETSKDVILFSERDSCVHRVAPSESSSGIGTLGLGSVWDSAGHMALSPTVSTVEDDYDDVFCTKDISMAMDDMPTDSRHRPKSGIWMEEPPDNFPDKDGDT